LLGLKRLISFHKHSMAHTIFMLTHKRLKISFIVNSSFLKAGIRNLKRRNKAHTEARKHPSTTIISLFRKKSTYYPSDSRCFLFVPFHHEISKRHEVEFKHGEERNIPMDNKLNMLWLCLVISTLSLIVLIFASILKEQREIYFIIALSLQVIEVVLNICVERMKDRKDRVIPPTEIDI
jgi:hypothetical protein